MGSEMCIRDRNYAGLRHGLYALYAVARLCRPGRRGALLDGRPRLLSDLAGTLLCLHPQRTVAEVEDLNFARRSLLCAPRNNDLLRFEFLSSHLAGLRPAGSHCENSGKSDDTCASARSDRAKSAVFRDRSANAGVVARYFSACLIFWCFWIKPKAQEKI